MKRLLLIGALSTLAATMAYSYDITHPNLKDAYALAGQAIQHIRDAQQAQANKAVEFGGHGDKAIQLFQQAQAELIEGDKYNDAHQKKK
jgi:hydroxymethylpyrimidine/phosphomethylpyrimidine kinase